MKTSLTWNQISTDGQLSLRALAPNLPLRANGGLQEGRSRKGSVPARENKPSGNHAALNSLSVLWLEEVREKRGFGPAIERILTAGLATGAIAGLALGASSSLNLVQHWQDFARLVGSLLL